ncbi:MAG: DUF370 domain-containing protein [Ruminococcaceae bacterium]|nr:DUF370 domain-containing protein [Oscillospiraceae bacterium]
MYVDIGTDFLIKNSDIVGIFDLDNTTTTTGHTNNFLKEKQNQGKVIYLVKDLPKSFVLTKDGTVYVVELSSQIIRRRLE